MLPVGLFRRPVFALSCATAVSVYGTRISLGKAAGFADWRWCSSGCAFAVR
jgi:hypothetical protein